MEKNLLLPLKDKLIAFHKKEDPRTFVGTLKEISDEHISILFNGQIQIHPLSSIVDVEEGRSQ